MKNEINRFLMKASAIRNTSALFIYVMLIIFMHTDSFASNNCGCLV